MPALHSLQAITQSPTSALLETRQFPQSKSSSSFRNGLHPAAIFGIVAGVLLLVVIIIWCCIFRLFKGVMTNKDHGLLPSVRIAANRHASRNHNINSHQYSQPQNSPYGPQPNFPGFNQKPNDTAYGGGPYGDQAPPPYADGRSVGLANMPAPAPSHSRSPSHSSTSKPMPPANS